MLTNSLVYRGPDKGAGGGSSTPEPIDAKVEKCLESLKIEKGSLLDFQAQALNQALLAYREGNYGIGAVSVLKKDGKVYVFPERNAMVTGRGVHDHAEARAIHNTLRYQREKLDSDPFPESEKRFGELVEPNEILDSSINPYLESLPDGIHVYGTLEPCPMCMMMALRAGAKTSVSGALDGEPEVVDGFVSTGGGFALGDKKANWPDVMRWIVDSLGLEFTEYSGIEKLKELSARLSEKDYRVVPEVVKFLEDNQYPLGSEDYYARAALEQALAGHGSGNDARGAVAVLVKNGIAYEFRDHDRITDGVRFKDTAVSRAVDRAVAFKQDELLDTQISDSERSRILHQGYDKRYNSELEDGLYVYSSVEPDPFTAFVVMNAGVKRVLCNAADGDLVESKIHLSRNGAACANGNKVSALPEKFQNKLREAGLSYKLLSDLDGQDPRLVKLLSHFCNAIFLETREEIDQMLGEKNRLKKEVVPDNFELVFTANDIEIQARRVGSEIANWISSERELGREVIVITNLQGGKQFSSLLERHLPPDVVSEVVKSSAYVRRGDKKETVAVDYRSFSELPEGCSVVVIDDICDSGDSLKAIESALREQGAKTVKSAVLLKRKPGSDFEPSWVGFEVNDQAWYVGVGMQKGGRYRGLENIYRILPEN